MSFNPNPHMLNLKGKDYLPVAPRLAWVNSDHEGGKLTRLIIDTELLRYEDITLTLVKKVERKDGARKTVEEELVSMPTQAALFRCVIKVLGDDGEVIHQATGHGYETQYGFGDFVTKAETASIGRALAALGYGTIQSLEFEEGDKVSPIDGKLGPGVVDAPVSYTPEAQVASPVKPRKARKNKAGSPKDAPVSSPEAREEPATPPGDNDLDEESQAILELLRANAHKPEVGAIIQKHVVEQRKITGNPDVRVGMFSAELFKQIYNEITPFVTLN